MANRSGDLGREGEKGIVNHINRWHADPELTGPRRARSKGSQDEGDITGVPLTTIECKNYSQIAPKMLMDNAREKAMRAKMPVWWLTVKKKGRSAEKQSGWWYAATDLLGLIEGLQLNLSDEEIDQLQSKERADDVCIIKPVGDLSTKFGNEFSPPKHRWSVVLYGDGKSTKVFESIYKMHDRWFKDADAYAELTRRAGTDLLIPISIARERGASPEDLEGWYAVTNVHFMGRILESLSILPQNEREYDPHDAAFWRHTSAKMTRVPECELVEEVVEEVAPVGRPAEETMIVLGSRCRTIPQHVIQRVVNWHAHQVSVAPPADPVTVPVLSIDVDKGATRFRCTALAVGDTGRLFGVVDPDASEDEDEAPLAKIEWMNVDKLDDFEISVPAN